jgi:glycosyltransferase involved in cell wall biosynthesis
MNNKNRNSIAAVISTFNGERYIQEQLKSIENQNLNIKFYIRDDGSTDNTVAKILEYFSGTDKLKYFDFNSGNVGVINSFFEILKQTSEDYVFLSDQDDVWLPSRCELLLNEMDSVERAYGSSRPTLIFSDSLVVDANLNVIANSFWRYQKISPPRKIKLNRILLQNYAPGCSMLLNRELVNKCTKKIPKNALMHDWWILIVASVFGIVGYVNGPSLKYRQHNLNVIGAKKISLISFYDIYIKAKKYKKNLNLAKIQIQEFIALFDDIPENKLIILNNFINLFSMEFFNKRYQIIKHEFFKPSIVRNIALLILI